MAEDSHGMGIPLPPDSTPVQNFPGVTRNAMERVAELLAGGITAGQQAAIDALAETAVAAELAEYDVAESVDVDYKESVGGVVDGDGRRTFMDLAADGGPSSFAAGKIAPMVQPIIGPAILASTGLEDRADLEAWGGGFETVDGREIFGFTSGGKFTEYTARKIRRTLTYPKPYIGYWTDSMGHTWHPDLAAATGLPVRNYDRGGQSSNDIAARQGGARALFTLPGNTLPATGAVDLAAWTVNPVLAAAPQPLSGTLAGVHGTLTFTGTDDFVGTLTFTRTGAGDAVTVAGPVEFISDEEKDTEGYGLIFAFTNDRIGFPIDATVSNVLAMVQRFESEVKRVLVFGSFPSSDMTLGTPARADFDARRAAVKAAVRGHWVDPFTDYFMTDQVFTDMGLTPTAQDVATRDTGRVPDQLRGDPIHLSGPAKIALAKWTAKRFLERGWIAAINN